MCGLAAAPLNVKYHSACQLAAAPLNVGFHSTCHVAAATLSARLHTYSSSLHCAQFLEAPSLDLLIQPCQLMVSFAQNTHPTLPTHANKFPACPTLPPSLLIHLPTHFHTTSTHCTNECSNTCQHVANTCPSPRPSFQTHRAPSFALLSGKAAQTCISTSSGIVWLKCCSPSGIAAQTFRTSEPCRRRAPNTDASMHASLSSAWSAMGNSPALSALSHAQFHGAKMCRLGLVPRSRNICEKRWNTYLLAYKCHSKQGGEDSWEFLEPNRLLAHVVERCPALAEAYARAANESMPTREKPMETLDLFWRICSRRQVKILLDEESHGTRI